MIKVGELEPESGSITAQLAVATWASCDTQQAAMASSYCYAPGLIVVPQQQYFFFSAPTTKSESGGNAGWQCRSPCPSETAAKTLRFTPWYIFNGHEYNHCRQTALSLVLSLSRKIVTKNKNIRFKWGVISLPALSILTHKLNIV